jgi:peroxiredoxin
MLSAGSQAPLFTLDDLEGASHSLAEMLSHGPVLLVLYKISCPTCQFTLPFLERLTHGSLQVVPISQDDPASTRRFRMKFGPPLLTLLDREEDRYPVSNAYGIEYVPSMFLVEAEGTISLVSEGFVQKDLAAIGARAGVRLFRDDEAVPAWKAG